MVASAVLQTLVQMELDRCIQVLLLHGVKPLVELKASLHVSAFQSFRPVR